MGDIGRAGRRLAAVVVDHACERPVSRRHIEIAFEFPLAAGECDLAARYVRPGKGDGAIALGEFVEQAFEPVDQRRISPRTAANSVLAARVFRSKSCSASLA